MIHEMNYFSSVLVRFRSVWNGVCSICCMNYIDIYLYIYTKQIESNKSVKTKCICCWWMLSFGIRDDWFHFWYVYWFASPFSALCVCLFFCCCCFVLSLSFSNRQELVAKITLLIIDYRSACILAFSYWTFLF